MTRRRIFRMARIEPFGTRTKLVLYYSCTWYFTCCTAVLYFKKRYCTKKSFTRVCYSSLLEFEQSITEFREARTSIDACLPRSEIRFQPQNRVPSTGTLATEIEIRGVIGGLLNLVRTLK